MEMEEPQTRLNQSSNSNRTNKIESNNISIINANEFPKPRWNQERNTVTLVPIEQGSLHGSAKDKVNLWLDRYYLILQRVKRSPLFSIRDGWKLTPLDSLLGGGPGKKFILGLLTQLKEGVYYLEDPKTNVPLDITDATFSTGLFVEGVIVIAEGIFSDVSGIFKVDTLALPPVEPRLLSQNSLGLLDLFAPEKTSTLVQNSKYPRFKVMNEKAQEPIPSNSEIIVLSDIHLDKPQVLQKLRVLFNEYESEFEEEEYSDSAFPPVLFIFLGNFTSSTGTLAENASILTKSFDKLTDMILSFKKLSHCYFVFVPGPSDPAGSVINILPKAPLPQTFTKTALNRIPKIQFTTNPTRVRFYGQDIVIFREDLVNRMRRHCIIDPVNDENIREISQHLVKTLLDQSHLCPLFNRSIYWNFDHCMYLWPIPDVMILADKYEQYEHKYDDTVCFNPGSFATDFSFVSFRPFDKSIDFSRIPEN